MKINSLRFVSFHTLLEKALPWLAWSLFLASLIAPAVHIDFGFHEGDQGSDWPGIVVLFLPPLIVLTGFVDFLQALSWQSLLGSILSLVITIGNFLLLILPIYSPHRLRDARRKWTYCAFMFTCTLSALITILSDRKMLIGAYLWLAAHIVLLAVSGFACLETIWETGRDGVAESE